MTTSDQSLWPAILEFYRQELRERYRPENLRRFDHFGGLSDDHINRLREFFLARVYPPVEERHRTDRAFEHLSAILHSSRRLQPLVRAGFLSAWRLGSRIPQAISAGRASFDAYRKTRLLEERLVGQAQALGVRPEDVAERARMLQLLAQLPEHDVRRLIEDVVELFRALNNPELLDTALDFMKVCEGATAKRRDLYTEEDTQAFQLGIAVMQDGLDLFRTLNPQEVPRLVEGIREVEMDWYRRIQEEAAAGTGGDSEAKREAEVPGETGAGSGRTAPNLAP